MSKGYEKRRGTKWERETMNMVRSLEGKAALVQRLKDAAARKRNHAGNVAEKPADDRKRL